MPSSGQWPRQGDRETYIRSETAVDRQLDQALLQDRLASERITGEEGTADKESGDHQVR